jgi:multisubunit Na+/H+ antiporter MnhG subunit
MHFINRMPKHHRRVLAALLTVLVGVPIAIAAGFDATRILGALVVFAIFLWLTKPWKIHSTD